MELEKYLSDLQSMLNKQLADIINDLIIPDSKSAELLNNYKYSVFYNDPYLTLAKGEIYFLGLNPGTDDSEEPDQKMVPLN